MNKLIDYFSKNLEVVGNEKFEHLGQALKQEILNEMMNDALKECSARQILNFKEIQLRLILISVRSRFQTRPQVYGLIVGKFCKEEGEYMFYYNRKLNSKLNPSIFKKGSLDYIAKEIINLGFLMTRESTILEGVPLN